MGESVWMGCFRAINHLISTWFRGEMNEKEELVYIWMENEAFTFFGSFSVGTVGIVGENERRGFKRNVHLPEHQRNGENDGKTRKVHLKV